MSKHLLTIITIALTLMSPLLAQQQSSPLTVQDIISIALQHNPQLTSSEQSINVAKAGLRQARSSYSPQLTLDASQGVQGSTVVGNRIQTGDGASLILGMTFWRSGRRDTVAQSQAGVAAATASYADRQLSVAALVAQDYYAVLAAGELVAVAKTGVEAAEQHRLQVQNQIEAGIVAPVEIHTVDDDLAQARLTLIDTRSTLRATEAALKTDMGIPYTTDLQLAPSTLGARAALPAETEAVAQALAQRPDLQAQQAVVQARQAAVRVAKAARGPVVDITGQAAANSDDFSDNSSEWGLTAGLTWPLADGGFTKAAEDAARANVVSSQADLQTLINEATLDVQNALIDLERSSERIKASEEALTAATARLSAAEVKYQEGLGILIEVTDARQAVTTAEAEVVRARFDYQVGQIALQRSTGALLTSAEQKEVPQ